MVLLFPYASFSFQLRESRTFTIQLLGKDDVKDDDSPAMIERWNQYMESFQKVGSLPKQAPMES